MNAAALALAERIVARADRAHPADDLLRSELKAQRGLSRDQAREASRAVFACFRWRGWLDLQSPLREQLQQGLALAGRFHRHPASFSDAELMARALPPWVFDEMEVTAPLARALQAEPILWLRARPGQGPALAAKLKGASVWGQGPLADILKYTGSEDLFRTREFHAGEFELQDITSQAVGLACGAAPGQTWWDVCAGEGGKTLHLSDLMANRGLIWASDRAAWRLQRLKRRAARARVFNYRAVEWDGGERLPTRTLFDGVLVDAPCSGIGTWHRNPHAKWTTTAQDVRELSQLQRTLLARCAKAVKPGGKLIYAVCTLTRAETAQVADRFERDCVNFEPLPVPHPLQPGTGEAAPRHQLLPQDFGGNGMFIAAWRRKA